MDELSYGWWSDLWKQGNRLEMFQNRYKHPFMLKRRCKGNSTKIWQPQQQRHMAKVLSVSNG